MTIQSGKEEENVMDINVDVYKRQELDDGSIHHLSAKKWNSVIRAGLKSCGYLVDQRVSNVTIRPCECAEQVC